MKALNLLSTSDALGMLRSANPDAGAIEAQMRYAIRCGKFTAPAQVAGAFVWSVGDIERLSTALGLRAPAIEGGTR